MPVGDADRDHHEDRGRDKRHAPGSTEDVADAYNAVMVVHPDGTLDPTWSAKIVAVLSDTSLPNMKSMPAFV